MILFPLKVIQIKKETAECVSIQLKPNPEHQEFFRNFKPGQYLTFEINLEGEKIRRSYSLSSSPFSNEPLTVAVKKVSGGRISVFLNEQLQIGDILWSSKPQGVFTPEISLDRQIMYYLFAGGSGITPIFSILKSILTQEPKSKVILLYANRNKDSVIFREELTQLKTDYFPRFKYFQALDKSGVFWSGLRGPLKKQDFTDFYFKYSNHELPEEFYVCGPSGMMKEVIEGLEAASVRRDKIKIEYFKAPDEKEKIEDRIQDHQLSDNKPTEALIKLNGKVFTLLIPKNTTILKAAQDTGLDPPYSCEAGVCSTCMAKLKKGQVRMIENNILTQKEVNEGFILTCQSLCLTSKVEIEYLD